MIPNLSTSGNLYRKLSVQFLTKLQPLLQSMISTIKSNGKKKIKVTLEKGKTLKVTLGKGKILKVQNDLNTLRSVTSGSKQTCLNIFFLMHNCYFIL